MLLENQTQRGVRSSKQIDSVHGGQQNQSGKTTVSKDDISLNSIY